MKNILRMALGALFLSLEQEDKAKDLYNANPEISPENGFPWIRKMGYQLKTGQFVNSMG